MLTTRPTVFLHHFLVAKEQPLPVGYTGRIRTSLFVRSVPSCIGAPVYLLWDLGSNVLYSGGQLAFLLGRAARSCATIKTISAALADQ